MKARFRILVLLLTSIPLVGRLDAQARPTASLTISGDISRPMTLQITDLKAMPRTTVSLMDQGREVKYEGVLVAEILKRAGAPLGQDMTGAAVSTYVVGIASDGYQAVFSLAELDPGFTRSEIIVADSADGKPLFDYQGPLRIVAPKDTRGARGVRMLEKLQVVQVRK
jgi:DMSO/TMAO reductase YedYZ molybdopterin-dependent catalytic subunit